MGEEITVESLKIIIIVTKPVFYIGINIHFSSIPMTFIAMRYAVHFIIPHFTLLKAEFSYKIQQIWEKTWPVVNRVKVMSHSQLISIHSICSRTRSLYDDGISSWIMADRLHVIHVTNDYSPHDIDVGSLVQFRVVFAPILCIVFKSRKSPLMLFGIWNLEWITCNHGWLRFRSESHF